jgi:hypothetical protein
MSPAVIIKVDGEKILLQGLLQIGATPIATALLHKERGLKTVPVRVEAEVVPTPSLTLDQEVQACHQAVASQAEEAVAAVAQVADLPE